ncbi:hypothetical protein BAE44_0014714 [Dichanthelium oligosanthes]|uniref:Uncharacterized protein n=1 Tax=Dichanthelium oligosanthes TaxID=888268 RepID=A0A1E5VGM9_9POAL|nr:hypothetical protein BAE44_0014714 [Dichanthelium oligosanthes]
MWRIAFAGSFSGHRSSLTRPWNGRSQTKLCSSSWTCSDMPCTEAITTSTPSGTNLTMKRRPEVRS